MAQTRNSVIFVRSQDRQLGTSSSFIVQLPFNFQNVSTASLVSAEIPFSWYNLDSPYIQGVTFTWNGAVFNPVLTPGQYGVSDLRAQLLLLLQGAYPGAGITAVNYSTISGQLSIAYTTGTLTVVSNTTGALGRILGTDPLGTSTIGTGGVLTFPAMCQLFPMTQILLCIGNLPASVVSTSTVNAFARVQVNCAPGGVVLINNGTNNYNSVVYTPPVPSLNTLVVELKNNDGSQVNLHGCDWTFSLLITHRD